MTSRIEQKKYFKLSFSVDVETADDVTWVREQMEKLEKEPLIMRCFQNVRIHNFTNNPKVKINDWSSDCNAFAIYFREENNPVIDRFLFKVRLKFPNFKHEFTHTVKEYN
jgi:hypothetical protein